MISTQRVNIYDELHVSPAEWGYHCVVGEGASEVQETEGLKETEETKGTEETKEKPLSLSLSESSLLSL